MTAVLDELSGLKEQRIGEFHAAVERMIAGEEIAADELELICLRAGKPTREFAAVVRKRQERAKERDQLEELPSVRQQLADVDAQIVANNETLEAARLAHQQKAWSLDATRNGLLARVTDLNGLQERLIRGCGDSSLDERHGTLRLYLDGLRRQRSEAERQLQSQMATLRQESGGRVDRWWVDRNALSPAMPDEVSDDDPFALFKRRVLRAQAALDDINRQESEYLAESADIRRKQFEW